MVYKIYSTLQKKYKGHVIFRDPTYFSFTIKVPGAQAVNIRVIEFSSTTGRLIKYYHSLEVEAGDAGKIITRKRLIGEDSLMYEVIDDLDLALRHLIGWAL